MRCLQEQRCHDPRRRRCVLPRVWRDWPEVPACRPDRRSTSGRRACLGAATTEEGEVTDRDSQTDTDGKECGMVMPDSPPICPMDYEPDQDD